MSDYLEPVAKVGQKTLRFSAQQTIEFYIERALIRGVRMLTGAGVLWLALSELSHSRRLLSQRFADLSPLDLGGGILIGLLGLGTVWFALYIAFGPGKNKFQAEKKWRGVMELEEYAQSIIEIVRQNWSPPPNSGVSVSCTLDVYQRPNGEIEDVAVRGLNNNDLLKKSIETALEESEPLPKPPVSSRNQRHLEFYFHSTAHD